MEPKLSHRRGVLLLPNQKTLFPSHSLSINRHFRGLSKKWRIQLQEMADGLKNSKQLLVHVVKEGETLTSISKQYGVSVYSIAAANKNIVDIDSVFEGQKLNIPSFSREVTQLTRKNRLCSFDPKEIRWRSLNIIDGILERKNFTVQITHGLPHAKTAGYFLVLVPLIAFCLRCMIGAFHARITGDSGCQAVNESKGHRHGSKNVRWKSALPDIIEGDALDSDSISDCNQDPSEDEAQVSFEESSHAYRKLEHEYEKFLSECGMSKWGYWRGGSPE